MVKLDSQSLKSTPVRAGLKVLLVFVGIVASLLLCELVLRFDNPFYARIKGNRIVLLVNKRVQVKNTRIPRLDPVITVSRNSLGFRGPDPPADFNDYLTIVTIGGSTTQCFMLSDEKTWTARLGSRLEDSFGPVWINNAGLDGHSTFGHIVLLEDYVTKLHPKVVLFLVGANDVAQAVTGEFESENIKGPLRFSSTKTLLKSASAHSEVAALILNVYRSLTAYQAGLVSYTDIDLTKRGYFTSTSDMENEFLEKYSKPYLPAYQTRLEKLVDVARNVDIEPVFITQPSLLGPAIDDFTKVDLARIRVGTNNNGKMQWDLLEVYNDVTRRVGLERDVLVIDLARSMPKSSRYFTDYVHFTNEGAQEVADIIYNSLCPMLANRYHQYSKRQCNN